MILVDTCGWIEWLTDGLLSPKYESYFTDIENILVPTSVQFELYKWVVNKFNVQQALEAIALTEQGQIAPLTTSIALTAADFAMEHKLSFADSIIYATAQLYESKLVTSDNHFELLTDVIYFKK